MRIASLFVILTLSLHFARPLLFAVSQTGDWKMLAFPETAAIYYGTKYSPGYAEQKFRSVEKEMTVGEVDLAMGVQPLEITVARFSGTGPDSETFVTYPPDQADGEFWARVREDPTVSRVIYSYTRPAMADSFMIRELIFDREGTVTEIFTLTSWG